MEFRLKWYWTNPVCEWLRVLWRRLRYGGTAFELTMWDDLEDEEQYDIIAQDGDDPVKDLMEE